MLFNSACYSYTIELQHILCYKSTFSHLYTVIVDWAPSSAPNHP